LVLTNVEIIQLGLFLFFSKTRPFSCGQEGQVFPLIDKIAKLIGPNLLWNGFNVIFVSVEKTWNAKKGW
jgi:hypothetical protein